MAINWNRIPLSTPTPIVLWLVLATATFIISLFSLVPGLAIALPIFLIYTALLYYYYRRRKRRRSRINDGSGTDSDDNSVKAEDANGSSSIVMKNLPEMLTAFRYEVLAKATDGFGTAVGHGGFGSVYRGTLADGTVVAVKCLPHDGDDESFQAEVTAMAVLNHTNLLRLHGVCAERFHRILVYEFMENSSLDHWIFSTPERRRQLDWKTRTSIALGAAKGLAYLHDDSRSCVLHLDIKPENILLDDNFQAKIADFGLAKSLKRDLESRWVTSRMRGTPGYMAPEWLYNRGVTAKSDVFGFGVVLLEIVCGRRCVDSVGTENSWYLPSLVFKKAREGSLEQTWDPAVEVKDREQMQEHIVRLAKIGLWCVQGNPGMRPSMSAVVSMIQGDLPVNEPPLQSNIPFAPGDETSFEALSHIC